MNNLLFEYERKCVPHHAAAAADEIILQEQSSPYTTPTNIRGSLFVYLFWAHQDRGWNTRTKREGQKVPLQILYKKEG